jgi:type II secretory pathway component GspD/PulD (secretin)
VQLDHAMASDVSYTLRMMLRERARASGEPAPSVDYNSKTNALLISATADQMSEVDQIIKQLDVASDEDRTSEFVRLEYADAEQAASALEVFYGRFAPEADTPAARSVTIVPDPGSNSLVISAPESEWQSITALLGKIDSAEYDTSRQMEVIPLVHADAASVARALNDGFSRPSCVSRTGATRHAIRTTCTCSR